MDSGTSFDLFTIFPILMALVYVALIVLGIYSLILFIKLARRGIKALDIYIQEKTNRGV